MDFSQYNKINSNLPSKFPKNQHTQQHCGQHMKFQSQPTEEIVSYQPRFDQQAGSYVPKMMTNAQNQAQCTVSRPQQSYSYAPELDIEYYQCTPKHPMMNQNPSPFQPVINSMRQFCISQPSGESNQISYQAWRWTAKERRRRTCSSPTKQGVSESHENHSDPKWCENHHRDPKRR